MTYGDLFKKFCEQYPMMAQVVQDYRSARGAYSIRVWLENHSSYIATYDITSRRFRLEAIDRGD